MRLASAMFFSLVALVTAGNDYPIIGILTVPITSEGGCITLANTPEGRAAHGSAASCFHNLYVKWLEQAGARVVPIPFDLPRDSMLPLLRSLNGFLFTGGESPIKELDTPYMQAAQLLLNFTIEANRNGTHLPLWGTCMGMQTLSILIAGRGNILESGIIKGMDPAMLPLQLTGEAENSRLLGRLTTPQEIRHIITSDNVTTNLHHDGIYPETFVTNTRLSSFYRVISTNQDINGVPFVSTIEAKAYPIYAAQWHAERPQFEWRHDLNHSENAIKANSWVARFFVDEARKNNRSFASQIEENKALIYNYQPVGNAPTGYKAYFF